MEPVVSKDVVMEPVVSKDVVMKPVVSKDVVMKPVVSKDVGYVEAIVETIEEKIKGQVDKGKGKAMEGKGKAMEGKGKMLGAASSYKDVVVGTASSSSKGIGDGKGQADKGKGKGGGDKEDKKDEGKEGKGDDEEDKDKGDGPNYENEKKGGLGKVPCDGCGKVVKWSKMFSQKEWLDYEEDKFKWWRWCAACCGTYWDMDEKSALHEILTTSGYAERNKRKFDEFKAAKERILEDYKAGGIDEASMPKGRKLYVLTRASLMKIFEEDIGDLIVLKVRQRKALQSTMEEHRKLLEKLKAATEVEEIRELVDAIDQINSAPPEYLGFAGHASQDTMWQVATYQDEITRSKGGSMVFYFMCDSGPSWARCQTLMTSKGWRRKFPDATGWVKGQRYYCVQCGACYKHSWGCIVQVQLTGDPRIYYMRAEVPDDDTLDLMTMRAEKRFFKPGMTSQELWNALPEVVPAVNTFVQARAGMDAWYFQDRAFFESLPTYKWVDILTYVD
jgi:hypothetical protein